MVVSLVRVRWTRVASVALCVCVAACRAPQRTAAAAVSTGEESAWFTDEARASGLDFVHDNGMSGKRYIAEIMAPGVALFDFDNDGDLDVYLVQGQRLGATANSRSEAAASSRAQGDRLFRNDLQVAADGSRRLHFTDVTDPSGIRLRSYGMGVAAGDYDNDGWTDLLVTRFGSDVLLHNNGDGTFADMTKSSRIDNANWSVAASFFDYDRDGWLDLYVGNYILYSPAIDTPCFSPSGAPDYCSPKNYRTVPGRLYHNQRNGTFADVTVGSGLARDYGPALGSIAADVDGDGWLDLYVANDGTDNQLWMNRHNGSFENRAVIAGVAVSGSGRAEGSMGVDAGDYDNDGDEDLLIANLTGEGMTLYANDSSGLFQDVAAAAGLRSTTLPFTGFGAGWIDVDNDGWLDILSVNGAIQTIQALAQAGDPFPLHQRKQLLRNTNGRFTDVSAQAGHTFQLSEIGRGAAFGDVDNDGDVDVLVGNNNGPVRLLVNRIGNRRHWLGIRAAGASGRDMLGAKVTLLRPDGTGLVRRVRSDGSYASASDPRVIFGLGDATSFSRVRVQWPGGRVEEWPVPGVDRWSTIREGTGR